MSDNEVNQVFGENNKEETESDIEQDKILQGQIRSHLNQDMEVCRKPKVYGRTPVNNATSLMKDSDLKFSAQNDNVHQIAFRTNHQMTPHQSTPTNENHRPNSDSVHKIRIHNHSNVNKFKSEPQIIYDKGVAYPPLDGRNIQTGRDRILQSRFINGDPSHRSPLQESRLYLSNTNNEENKDDEWSCVSSLSRKLSEENLECDSLRYDPDYEKVLSPGSTSSESSPETSYKSSAGVAESLNLIDLKSIPKQKSPPFGKLVFNGQELVKSQSVASELLKSIQVVGAEDKQQMAPDGPTITSKLVEHLTKNVIPEVQKLEEEKIALKGELSKLRREKDETRIRDKQFGVTRKNMEYEYKHQSDSDSLSSQTHVLGQEHAKTKQPERFSIQVSETRQDTYPLKKIEQLEAVNQKLTDANRQWETQWDVLKRNHATEVDHLNQVIRTFKEQDARRQEDFDKILLTAKRRQNDEEAAKEEALGQLAQMSGRCEELEALCSEFKAALEERIKEKNIVETELMTLKTENMKLSGQVQKTVSKKTDKKQVQQLQTELAVLQQQLTVFQEDFDRERQDRERAQSDKINLNEQIEQMNKQNRDLTEKLRSTEHQLQTTVHQVSSLQREIIDQQNRSRQPYYVQNPSQQNTMRQPLVSPEYHNPLRQQPQNRYSTPKAQPETDPHARPLPPYMITPQGNDQFAGQGIPRTSGDVRQNQPLHFSPWNCVFCTYINHPQRSICEICGTHRGQGNMPNGNVRQGSQTYPRLGNRFSDPNDICIDSDEWSASR